MKLYVQCRLRRGNEYTTGWIETRGARAGTEVEFVPDGTRWEVIFATTEPILREDQLKEYQLLNRRSLPSIEAMR